MRSKINQNETGTFSAKVVKIRKRGIYFLELQLLDYTLSLSIDIHDILTENIPASQLTSTFIKKLESKLPRIVKVSFHNGYWKIENETQIFSDAISKSL